MALCTQGPPVDRQTHCLIRSLSVFHITSVLCSAKLEPCKAETEVSRSEHFFTLKSKALTIRINVASTAASGRGETPD